MKEMLNLKIFSLQACYMLFMSVPFSDAGKRIMTDPKKMFSNILTIESFVVQEPNQNSFTHHFLTKQMFLGIHYDWKTFSFYESDATYSFLTFKREEVDFENFHSKSMSFHVEEDGGIYHFRVVFSANKTALDTLYMCLGAATGRGRMTYKLGIVKVERYERTSQMRDPVVQKVEDLQPAMFFEQKIEVGRLYPEKIYKITPLASLSERTQPKLPRLVFRTGTFRAGRVTDKVVLELSGFEGCFYILHMQNSFHAESIMEFVNGMSENVALRIPFDVHSYMESGILYTSSSTQIEPDRQLASLFDQDDSRTLQLANWSGEQSRSDKDPPSNKRTTSHDKSD